MFIKKLKNKIKDWTFEDWMFHLLLLSAAILIPFFSAYFLIKIA